MESPKARGVDGLAPSSRVAAVWPGCAEPFSAQDFLPTLHKTSPLAHTPLTTEPPVALAHSQNKRSFTRRIASLWEGLKTPKPSDRYAMGSLAPVTERMPRPMSGWSREHDDILFGLRTKLSYVRVLQARGHFSVAHQFLRDVVATSAQCDIGAAELVGRHEMHPLVSCGLFSDMRSRDLLQTTGLFAYHAEHIPSLLVSKVFGDQPGELRVALERGRAYFPRYTRRGEPNSDYVRLMQSVFACDDARYAAMAFGNIAEAAQAAIFCHRPELARSIYRLFDEPLLQTNEAPIAQ